jgi:hypothetical protein
VFLFLSLSHRSLLKKGMANWRRWNENNVDLNRNTFMNDNGLKQMLTRDSNIAGYDDLMSLLNPAEPPTTLNFLKFIPYVM